MKLEEVVKKITSNPSYLRNGNGYLSKRWNISQLLISEAKFEAKRLLGQVQNKGIKRLFFDIETAPTISYVWRTGYNLNVPYTSIAQDSCIMCISYKWADEDTVHNVFWNGHYDDKNILEKFIPIIKQADEVVTHNGDKFDIKWISARAAKHFLNIPNKFRSFDTYKKCKAQFALNSYSLKYVTSYFGLTGKLDTGGFGLWRDIIERDCQEARKHMIEYCNTDVIALEDLYNFLVPYTKPITNHAILKGGHKWDCPTCASKNVSLLKRNTPVSGIIKCLMECDICNVKYDISNRTYLTYLDYKRENGNT